MYTDLVIGFDGSPAGRDAVAFGRRLATATGARPTVLYVRPRATAPDGPHADGEGATWHQAVEEVLDEARELLAGVPDVAYQGVVERSAAHALRSAAAVGGASLLVLGSTHRSGLGRLAPGTTADQVLHTSPCAVAVAPPGFAVRAPRPFRLVAAAVDGGEESERVARLAGRIARSSGATLRIVHVIDHHSPAGPLYTGGIGDAALADSVRERATETLERARTAAAGEGRRIEQRAYEGRAAEQLILRSNEFDLLVVGSRGYGAVRRVVPGSVSSKVLREADCPVLVLPRQAPEGRDGSVAELAGGRSEQRGAAVTP
jgi:nucleotide-binding universal stress UspA family protein